MITFNISCEKHIEQLIKMMINKIVQYKYHIFISEIGAGKTTLIKIILKLLDVSPEEITSPTFNYIKIIDCSLGKAAHIDLFRVETKVKAIEIFYSELADIYLIEWGKILIEDENIYNTINNNLTIWKIEQSFNNKILNINRNFI